LLSTIIKYPLISSSKDINETTMSQRILVRLNPGHLLIANTGKAFSKEGLEAICYTDTSSEDSHNLADRVSEEEIRTWLADLITNQLRTFSDPKRLRSVCGTEKRTATDYSGRLLLELLQNAIDADREEQIGYKGIGFRSVLNEAAVIEIHSGRLHVRWSEVDARAALAGFQDLPANLPILDLPAWQLPEKEIIEVLTEGYTTVIRLSLTEDGQEHVQSEWSSLVGDPSLLLFIDGLIEIQWEHHDGSKLAWTRCDGEDGLVTIIEAGKSIPPRELYWRCFKHETASAAYPVNDQKRLITTPAASPRLRCYFSAKKSPHPFPNLLLHNSRFGLQSNREVVVLDEARLEELAQAILLATGSVESEGEVLDLLQVSRFQTSDETLPETALWNSARGRLISAKLYGLNNRTIGEVRTCPSSDDIPLYGRPKQERFKRWAAFLSSLQQEGVRNLPVLSPGVENEERESTLLMFNAHCRYTAPALKTEKWAPVEGLAEAASSSETTLFLPHGGSPLVPPQGIAVHFLRQSFIKAFEGFAGAEVESFLTEFLGVAPFAASTVIQRCVLGSPCVGPGHAASPELIQFLKSLREADAKELKKTVESFDWRDEPRRQLVQQLYLQLQGRTWPVLQVYAPQSWTGDGFLESAFGLMRGYLEMEPPVHDEEKASWESFWKWLGVGWCPKVIPTIKDVLLPKDVGGWNWNERVFKGSQFCHELDLSNWEVYCCGLKKAAPADSFQRSPIMKANWTIDGGPRVLACDRASEVIPSNWQHYQPFLETEIRYSSRRQRPFNEERNADGMQSYLHWLLRVCDWLPCTDGRRHSGKAVFKRDGAVAKTIPSFVPVLDEEAEPSSQAAKSFFVSCGIRGGWDEVRDDDWLGWLKDAEQRREAASGSKSVQESIRSLYRALLKERRSRIGTKWNEKDVEPLVDVRLWMVERRQDSSEAWIEPGSPSGMYYLDRGELADLALPGLRLFPQRLDGLASKAEFHFGILPLSRHLSGAPLEEGSLANEFSDAAIARVNELVAFFCAGDAKLDVQSLKVGISSVKVRRVDKLEVSFRLNESPIGTSIKRQEFQRELNDGSWVAYVDSALCLSNRQWEVFAETLLLACGLPMDKRKDVRDLLQYPIQDLSEELIRLGVAPETVEALKEKHPVEIQAVAAQDSVRDEPQGSSAESEQATRLEPIETRTEPTSTTPSSRSGVGQEINADISGKNQRQRQATRPHPEGGMSAQRWLFERIEQWCLAHGWPQPLWEQDYIDITIPIDPPILIEAKSIEKKTVHWTENQVRTAQSAKGRYVVALLRLVGSNTDDYEVFWVTNPLEAFGNLPDRHIKWTWQDQDGERFALQSWHPPLARPQKAASSFQAVISLDDQWIGKLTRGIEGGMTAIMVNADNEAVAEPPM
jgi:hypothetical protein